MQIEPHRYWYFFNLAYHVQIDHGQGLGNGRRKLLLKCHGKYMKRIAADPANGIIEIIRRAITSLVLILNLRNTLKMMFFPMADPPIAFVL